MDLEKIIDLECDLEAIDEYSFYENVRISNDESESRFDEFYLVQIIMKLIRYTIELRKEIQTLDKKT